MSARQIWLTIVLLATVIGLSIGSWYWFMEPYAKAVPFSSEQADNNPMLGALRLLQQQGRDSAMVLTLADVKLAELGDGVLLVPNAAGVVSAAQADALEAWVRRGNVLVTAPRWLGRNEVAFVDPDSMPKPTKPAPPADADEDAEVDDEASAESAAPVDPKLHVETDPIAARLGVRRTNAQAQTRRCSADAPPLPEPAPGSDGTPKIALPHTERLACVPLPGQDLQIEVDSESTILATLSAVAKGVVGPKSGEALRDYKLGKGHIVMVPTNYFDNEQLNRFDHAELLLALAALQPHGKIVIVEQMGVMPWKTWLWQNFSFALVAATLALLLALWMALRRFGPLLPGPREERRSLMEHVIASGTWLWKTQTGRDLLLDAVRKQVMAIVRRRLPALDGLDHERACALLARLTTLAPEALDSALHAPAAAHTQEFTRQIRTLQELRKEYER